MAEIILSQIPISEFVEQVAEKVIEKINQEKSDISSKNIIDIDVLSDEYSIPKPTIYAWTSNHEIPHIKKGKRLYFDRTEIEEWFRKSSKPALCNNK